MNEQTFVGNVGADPVLRTSPSGANRATFSVAVTEKNFKTDEEKTHWVNVTAFGTLGENIVSSIKKGMRVIVYARIDSYKTPVVINGEAKDIDRISYTAVAVGPDLNWAVATVAKTDRPAQQAQPAQQAAQPAAAAAAQPAAAPAPQPVAAGVDDF